MRDARLAFGACLLTAVLSSCREKPAPPPDEGSAPASSPRPLTSSLPPGHPPVDAAPPPGAAASDAASIAGTITVSPNLQSRAAGGALFVIARSAADHRILAVRREDNVTFPFKFRISGRDAMIAGTAFAGPLDVTVRLSKSGDAAAAKGDIEGTARGLRVGAEDAKVTLDTVHE